MTTKTNQLNINVITKTITDSRQFIIKSLLNWGSTGSAVDSKWVERNEIPTRKAIIPIQVYNTDGSLNLGGPITDYITLRITIQDHVEQLEFAVSDLGTQDMFIGHEWLKMHNPSIDWRKAEI